MTPLFAFLNLTPWEIMIILIIGVLLFGRKLPEVGRSLGKSITEFRKGYKGLEDELDVNAPVQRPEQGLDQAIRAPQKIATSAPKFEDTSTAITAPPKV